MFDIFGFQFATTKVTKIRKFLLHNTLYNIYTFFEANSVTCSKLIYIFEYLNNILLNFQHDPFFSFFVYFKSKKTGKKAKQKELEKKRGKRRAPMSVACLSVI